MRRTLALLLLAAAPLAAQMNEQTKTVAGGGVLVAGWSGQVDANEAKNGQTIANAKFAAEGKGFHVTTGPSAVWWSAKNTAAGDYTVKATFTEPKYMSLNDHPHPYGLFIGGKELGTDKATLLYCTAYGNGTFIVRGFGPAPFRVGAPRATANPAVAKAAGAGASVTQEIALQVKGDQVSCIINGTTVATHSKAEIVGPGKLASTDGIYGIRAGHNTEVVVTGLEKK